MTDDEFDELKGTVRRLEGKIDTLLARPKKRSGFLWKELVVGYFVVYVIMTALIYGIAFLNARFDFFH